MTPSKKAVAIPVAWITDTESADLHGWISCKAWSEGEFTTPLVLQSDLAAAIARAEALERDAERWRFCVDRDTMPVIANDGKTWCMFTPITSNRRSLFTGKTPAEAIDAAIAAQQAEGEDRG